MATLAAIVVATGRVVGVGGDGGDGHNVATKG